MSKKQWEIRAIDSTVLLFLISLFYSTYYNFIFLNKLYNNGFSLINIFFVWLLIISLIFSFLSILLFKRFFKAFLIILFISSSITYHFMEKYGIFVDSSMIKNLFETDFKEASEFITLSLIKEIIISGIIPSLIIYIIPIKYENGFIRILFKKLKYLSIAFLISLASFFLISDQLISLFRSKKELRYYIIPSNYISSLIKFSKKKLKKKQSTISIGDDIRIENKEPLFVILVVGESVRSKNWGLSGYKRNTNPLLSRVKNLFNFIDVSSCGTDTETSLPCMFSIYGRKNYNESKIKNTQSLLNVLNKGGVDVVWIDNQSGDKGVAKGLTYIETKRRREFCVYDRCFDEILIEEAKDILIKKTKNTLLVLHMIGNHGPAYFKRYPSEFEYFKPTCKTEDLSKCSKEEIINTYDNIIRYTDFVIYKLINFLSNEKRNSLLIYISDHGESLGEKGIYLHGIPYLIAPEEQKKIPFVIWFSEKYLKMYKKECIINKTKEKISHDNLFHIILGLFEAKTSIYDRKMDFLRDCRN